MTPPDCWPSRLCGSFHWLGDVDDSGGEDEEERYFYGGHKDEEEEVCRRRQSLVRETGCL